MFSIIMPVWNRAGLVSRAIDSVLAQTFKDYELLIIDDGSDDNLEQVVRPYLSDKVTFERICKSGTSAARNLGIEKARYPILAYLDSDNCWHREFLETMYGAIKGANSKYAAAYCIANRFRKDAATGKAVPDGTVGEAFGFKKLVAGNYIDINTLVHTKDLIEYTGMFDTNLKRLQDWDFILRIAALIEPIFVPRVLVDYYYGAADNTITMNENLELALNTIYGKYAGFNGPFTHTHDAIPYVWNNLPERKHRNFWTHLNQKKLNTSEYTAWAYPFMLQIEPTNACNLECPLCPVGRKELGRKTQHMSLEVFKSIIDDMEDYLLFLVLWDWGEPFMNAHLPEMIRYASERDIRTVTSTNAHFLEDDAYIEAILTSGLSTLIVAIDSAHDDIYQQYRRKGSLSKVLAGLQKVVEMKKRLGSETLINMRMVIMRHNEHELRSLKRLARKLEVDWFTVKTLNPSCGSAALDNDLVPRNPKYRRFEYDTVTGKRILVRTLCQRPWEMANILSNGDVVPCCYDFDASMKIGNVTEKPFSEIWNSPAYQQLRKKIFNEKDSIEKCRDCWTSFKLSKSGWFVESYNLTESTLEQLKKRFEWRLRKTPIWKILRAGRNLLRKVNWISGNKLLPNLKGRPCTYTSQLLSSQIRTLELPLEEDKVSGWKAYNIFKGRTCFLKNFSCHVSVLSPGKTPHQPHEHAEEEILVMISGEAELVIIDTKREQIEKRHRLQAGSFVYYPAWQRHTLNNPGTQSITYLMFKWESEQVGNYNTLEMSTIQFLEKGRSSSYPDRKSFSTTLLIDGGTQYLRKLHSHITTLQPGSGYPPHEDAYDVAILVLRGSVETLGQRVGPNSVIFYAAGEPHGMKNVGTSPALYLVFEFHGGVSAQLKNLTKLKSGHILPCKDFRAAKNSTLVKVDKNDL